MPSASRPAASPRTGDRAPNPHDALSTTLFPPPASTVRPLTCDIFCTVIDNFGDIGVCWRLARQLSAEHGWRVRLLVDDLHTFQKLCPALSTDAATQTIEGVTVERWHTGAHADRNTRHASATSDIDDANDARTSPRTAFAPTNASDRHAISPHASADVRMAHALTRAAGRTNHTSDANDAHAQSCAAASAPTNASDRHAISPHAGADVRMARALTRATGGTTDTSNASDTNDPNAPSHAASALPGASDCPSEAPHANTDITGTARPYTRTANDTPPLPLTALPADVVIEAFACELPPAYVDAMAQRARAPVWLNLEYLGTEDWVADFHLRPSPHPRHALTKTFFFPGLAPGTGGLLKERDLDAARAAFETSPDARAAWWRDATGDAPPAADATVISLFAYDNPALASLLAQWRDTCARVVLLVPQGRVSHALARFFDLPSFDVGARAQQGSLRAHGLAFTDQRDYDRLLWASDLNFVRGEDSFARAQWAARAFVWHIYPQADAAHRPKLDAALERYARALPATTQNALRRFWHAWNGQGDPDWADFAQHLPQLRQHAATWAAELAQVGDLAGNLAGFVKSRLE